MREAGSPLPAPVSAPLSARGPARLPGLAAVAATVAALTVTTPAAGDPASRPHVVVRPRDPRITESSGLVALPGAFVTTNDSGDVGRLFVVDAATGRTRRVVGWSPAPTDVEALAPAGGGRVWVADIGDNAAARRWVEVALVSLRPGGPGPRRYRLAFPGGATDAEALLAHPRTGRLYVAEKALLGGRLFAAPVRLRAGRANRLTAVAPAPSLVTDGAFAADGAHLLLRGYAVATVYSFPAMDPVASFALPTQPQGEGLAVGVDGRVYLSSERPGQPILQAVPPRGVRALLLAGPRPGVPATAGPAASAAPSGSGAPRRGVPSTEPTGPASGDSGDRPARPLTMAFVAGAAALTVGWLALRRRRRSAGR